jgi:hypothetical protein
MINRTLNITLFFLVILTLFTGFNLYYYDDYQTSLLPGVFIQEAGSDLVSNRWSVPLVADWDGDDKKDLLTGNENRDMENISKGYISFYQNKGTDNDPAFEGFEYIKTCSDVCSDLTVTSYG